MTPSEIQQIVNATLISLGLIKPYVTQAEAFRMYGRTNVERWVKEGLVKPVRDTETSTKRYLRTELEQTAINNNVLNKFSHVTTRRRTKKNDERRTH